MKIGMVSLGCDKNRVDSEKVLFSLTSHGHTIVQDAKEADIILINTCSFIESAKKESIDTILEYSEIKRDFNKKLVVLGCMPERYESELKEAIPEVDRFVRIKDYKDIAKIISGFENGTAENIKAPCLSGRVLTTPPHYAYLKIADGCNNNCAYCAIPFIRGSYKSQDLDSLLSEARALKEENGVKELILVAQDTTRYGSDIYGSYKLTELLKRLLDLDFYKIRLMYCYPELVSKELLSIVEKESGMAKYLDIPLQHISNSVLKRMNRRSSGNEVRELIGEIKARKNIALRSGFITGFPQETESEFEELKEFIESGSIDYAGFFAYSREEGTTAFSMKPQISKRTATARATALSKIQSTNIVKNHQKYAGEIQSVIYEGIDYSKKLFFGRNQFNAPEIDTKVFFKANFPLEIGEVYPVKIDKADFNLYGEVIR
ncbi:MAG: 30S ribosomal protein S12 methylthiotransferase RimO [Firmicutes bacterium]|nr:30S ribosomal protein S12 methylthiotransferase RimO [Bacillota bacterium]